MKIVTYLIKEGSKKTLRLKCPNCRAIIERQVDKEQLSDDARCNLCDSVFFWSIKD